MPTKLPIYFVGFPTQYLCGTTMMRFQEHYESPKFAGASFSREEYEDWYEEETGGRMYHQDWSGFNFPVRALARFYLDEDFLPFTRKESAFLDHFSSITDGYIIATGQKSHSTVAHEIVHGCFFLDEAYRTEVLEAIKVSFDADEETRHFIKQLSSWLTACGYMPRVIMDEINAYVCTGLTGVDFKMNKAFSSKLKKIFKKYYPRVWGKDWLAKHWLDRIHILDFDHTAMKILAR